MRRILVSILIIFIFVFSCPLYMSTYSYADADPDPIATREQVTEAFKAYCRARNLIIDGTVLGAVTKFMGNTVNTIVDELGIDMDYLQSQINIQSSGLGTKYLLSASGVGIFNRIFAELLQREELEVGDTDVNKIVYSGDMFTSYEGDTCLIYHVNTTNQIVENNSGRSLVTEYGTPLKYDSEQLYNIWVSQIGIPSITNYGAFTIGVTPNYQYDGKLYYYKTAKYYWLSLRKPDSSNQSPYYYDRMRVNEIPSEDTVIDASYDPVTGYGNPAIIKLSNNKIYFGFISFDVISKNRLGMRCLHEITEGDYQPTDVVYKTPDDEPIKPDLPDDEPISFDPDGNTDDNPSDPDEPIDPWPPSGGTGGTPPDWDTGTDVVPDGDGWNIPFHLPDLDIDWSIEGLQNKFPFSIPFDIYHLCSVLNATPQTPELSGTIDLKIYQWDIDMDLHDFDSVAAILRTMELIGFIIGLIMITRSIIKG